MCMRERAARALGLVPQSLRPPRRLRRSPRVYIYIYKYMNTHINMNKNIDILICVHIGTSAFPHLRRPLCLFNPHHLPPHLLPPHKSNYLSKTDVVLPNNRRQHRTSHAPNDVLPLRICANYCVSCQPLLRAFPNGFDLHLPPPPLICFDTQRSHQIRKGVPCSQETNPP